MTDSNGATTPIGIPLPKACDGCRSRKIRCDKITPCSNCRTAKIQCRTSDRSTKEQRQRVLISNQYEQKIDAIENRLSGIEKLLERLVENQTNTPSVARRNLPNSTQALRTRDDAISRPDTPSEDGQNDHFEGESSLTASSDQAHRTLESLLRQNTKVRNDPDVASALSSLQEMQRQGSSDRHISRFSARISTSGVTGTPEPMPPLPVAMDIIRQIEDSGKQTILAWFWYMCFDVNQFASDCKRYYANPDESSVALQVIVHGGLHAMFSGHPLLIEHPPNKTDPSGVSYRTYAERCRINLKNALLSFPMILSPTLENIMALASGSAHSIQVADFSLCWSLTCTAARLCQSLGWHRKNVVNQNDSKEGEIKKGLFWTIYFNDKCLSLRLGVSSTFQDYDVALEFPEFSAGPQDYAWTSFMHLSLEVATLHGLIYEKLYSPGASGIPSHERASIVHGLSRRVQDAALKNDEILETPEFKNLYMKNLGESYQVLLDCLLTLIYRKLPVINTGESNQSLVLNSHCIQAARSAMQSHQRAIQTLQAASKDLWLEYFNWTVLNCPFTPFMVVFSNCVNKLDKNDLVLLENFVSSLSGPAQGSSDAIIRFHQLCDGFHKLAKAYIAANLRDVETSGVQAAEFFTYPTSTVPQKRSAAAYMLDSNPSSDAHISPGLWSNSQQQQHHLNQRQQQHHHHQYPRQQQHGAQRTQHHHEDQNHQRQQYQQQQHHHHQQQQQQEEETPQQQVTTATSVDPTLFDPADNWLLSGSFEDWLLGDPHASAMDVFLGGGDWPAYGTL